MSGIVFRNPEGPIAAISLEVFELERIGTSFGTWDTRDQSKSTQTKVDSSRDVIQDDQPREPAFTSKLESKLGNLCSLLIDDVFYELY